MPTDPDPVPIRTQGFDDQKLEKIYSWQKIWYCFEFDKNIAIYFSLGLHTGCPSYRRSFQPSKENIPHFKTRNFLTFFSIFLWDIFALMDPDPLSWLNPDPDPKHWVLVSKRTRYIGLRSVSFDTDAMKCGTLNINTNTQMEKDLVQNGVDLHVSGFPKSRSRNQNLCRRVAV